MHDISGSVKRRTLTLLLLTCLLGACSSVEGLPQSQNPSIATLSGTSTADTIRQTDARGRPLPFTNTFPRRWSNGNDGTTYEPCTAATMTILAANSLDPLSVKDAAIVDHQTARGCRWSINFYESAYLSQIVGNQPQLDIYKKQQNGIVEWMPDISIRDRRAAVGSSPSATDCTTFVQSGAAIVATRASMNIYPLTIDEICDKAIAFTRATIDQMPE